jgi:hypothetical protein
MTGAAGIGTLAAAAGLLAGLGFTLMRFGRFLLRRAAFQTWRIPEQKDSLAPD